ncbi:MAG: HPr family phosphocarrier protein [Lachnospiraceae bacterium]|nr:HPr family phosphocarrier protein [Lachnospiraceae bacterium]
MKQLYYRVKDPNGFHVRPSIKVAECLKKYHCDSIVECGKKVAKGKDAVGIRKMHILQGELILFSLNGEEEDEACQDLQIILKKLNSGNQVY